MAVTDYQSLYGACNKVALDGVSSIQSIGGYDTFIELYTQDDIDNNYNDIVNGNYDSSNNLITKCNFGSSDQSRIVLIAGDDITIPSGYTLIPPYAKKSLVILCGKLVNNGIISMTGRGPNILPHEYYILGETDGFDENIIIPAYANNGVSWSYSGAYNGNNGSDGNNGVNRQCGSGGGPSNIGGYNGSSTGPSVKETGKTGSGYAFGGGAGCGGTNGGIFSSTPDFSVNSTYPMRGSNASRNASYPDGGPGGVGNPPGNNLYGGANTSNVELEYTAAQNTGVGGRIIIFCTKFENNGTILANGINSSSAFRKKGDNRVHVNSGGASGGGAVDLFYKTLVTQGTITANGGQGVNGLTCGANTVRRSGNGGNGSVTLTQYSMADFVLPGYANKETLTKFVELVKTALATKANKDELDSIIDDTQQYANKTYSSKKIESMIPTSISDLTNDAGFLSRYITAREVRSIWDDTEV